jgi:hypothetical protein
MPCYIKRIEPPSKAEYEIWQSIGFSGSWADYCQAKQGNIGEAIFICGDLGAHCADCAGVGDFLCDYPVGDGKTCDRPMCGEHAHEVAPEIHYCDAHYRMWDEFRRKGGVDAALRNVIAFKAEK